MHVATTEKRKETQAVLKKKIETGKIVWEILRWTQGQVRTGLLSDAWIWLQDILISLDAGYFNTFPVTR